MDDDDHREVARQQRIADACVGADPADGRLGLYRSLIQRNLSAVTRRLLPRSATHIGLARARSGSYEDWFARFLAEVGPRTPYLRDVAPEFVAWAAPQWATDRELPPFLVDVANREMDLFAIEWAPREPQPHLAEVSADRALAFATPRRLTGYAYRVHEGDPPPEGTTHLLIHRDAENTVHTTVVEPERAGLLAAMLDGAPAGAALDVLGPEALAEWLARLADAGALLGGRIEPR